MDYIREELLRQQALLVILLTGQRTEPLAEERADPSAGEWAGAAAERDAAAVRRRSAAGWEALARTAGEIPPEAGEIRLVTEVRRPESGRSADPAALSLAFQRDARRYDGGFRLY